MFGAFDPFTFVSLDIEYDDSTDDFFVDFARWIASSSDSIFS
jgi:hypothetical protein